jgi:hypothetical protein
MTSSAVYYAVYGAVLAAVNSATDSTVYPARNDRRSVAEIVVAHDAVRDAVHAAVRDEVPA